ncbi:MAG TPA: helix-turn-helix domain-containing protein [Iamia sp.]|nr:helix-turn-helix domain-containing protein [Iamia sp.]
MRQDARNNRERILQAADAVFGEHGAAGSTEEVARRAGVGIGTVFRHFPTKEALLSAALSRHLAALGAVAEQAMDAPDGATGLRSLVEAMVRTGGSKVALASLLDPLPLDARTASEELRRSVGVVLRRAKAEGAVRPTVTLDQLYLLIRGLSHASAMAPPSARALRGATDIVLAGLLVDASEG